MQNSNTTVLYNKAPGEIRGTTGINETSGLFAHMRLCCLLYAVVTLLLLLSLTFSARVFPAVVGMSVLVTCYVVSLMIEFVICGERDELHG